MEEFEGAGDEVLTCKDCSQEFVFTAGEQAFYQQKGFAVPPKRCKSCREKKKAGGDMGGGNGFGGGMGGGGGGGGGGRHRSMNVEVQEKPSRVFRPRDGGGGGGGGYGGGRENRTRVEVQCSECGVKTTVPFEPAPGRPVYCRDCYHKRRG